MPSNKGISCARNLGKFTSFILLSIRTSSRSSTNFYLSPLAAVKTAFTALIP